MADYQNKQNEGALFKNNKRKTDNHPEYTGSINVNGQDFWLSAWVNESQAGTKYFKMSVKPKQDKESQPNNNDLQPF